LKNCLPTSFFKQPFLKKALPKIREAFEFENLIPKPYRCDHKPFQKSLSENGAMKFFPKNGVINRRNG
jgi:hypothetical protein